MSRYKITIEYDGTNYAGWQKQPDQKTIQGVIEEALFKAFNKKIEISGSGRTDAGVHAISQIAHFDVDNILNEFQMMMAINRNISFNEAISITSAKIVSDDFNSRFDAKIRSYHYLICNRKPKLALDKNRMWHVPFNLNLEKMLQAKEFLIGKHDFSSFKDSECQNKNPIRTVKDITITKEADIIKFEISAKSFLHHMVRNIVGTLYLVGREKIDAIEVKNILEQKDRTKSGPNAPACGLYFLGAKY